MVFRKSGESGKSGFQKGQGYKGGHFALGLILKGKHKKTKVYMAFVGLEKP